MTEQTVAKPAKKDRWWAHFIWSALMVAGAVFLYNDLATWEESGTGTKRMNAILALVYDVFGGADGFGKEGVAGVLIVGALAFAAAGILGYRKTQQAAYPSTKGKV